MFSRLLAASFATLILFLSLKLLSYEMEDSLKQEFIQAGGSQKSIEHLDCFLKNYERSRFLVKETGSLQWRCNQIESGTRALTVNNMKWAVIVDYIKTSNKRRFYLINLDGSEQQRVRSYYVSHGRYGNTSRSNTRPGKNRNTVKAIKYYSNTAGSNASASGFYISGHAYQGRWTGANGDKHSLVLHGIERDVNDNSCERATVIHGNSYIQESGNKAGVRRMSSGCYMLDYDHVNEIVGLIRGSGGSLYPQEVRAGGAVFFNYGLREEKFSSDHYCKPEAQALFRLDQ